MKININVKLDKRTFIFLVILVLTLFLSQLIISVLVTDGSIIAIQHYQNCSVESPYPTYWETKTDWTYKVQEHKECCYPSNCYENIEDMPQDCDCIYPVACGTLEELGIG